MSEVAILGRSQSTSPLVAVGYSGEITSTRAEYEEPDRMLIVTGGMEKLYTYAILYFAFLYPIEERCVL